MKKLNVGDYVKNLTKEQHDEIMSYQPSGYGKYCYLKGQTDKLFISKGFIDFPFMEEGLSFELSFNEFIERLKVTF